jgi:osmotically-inducible protein OsmY
MSATVKEVMTTHVVAVKMNTSFKEMATRLRADGLSVYSRPDAQIQQVIQDLVKLNHAFVASDRFNVSVNNGVVTLEGRPEDADSGQAIVADAWHVEGVVSVRDRFDYPPSDAEGI